MFASAFYIKVDLKLYKSNLCRNPTALHKKCYMSFFLIRLKKHFATYEPSLNDLKKKYESAMREKMLTKMELDKTLNHISDLENSLVGFDSNIAEMSMRA